jgi:hypothetical protein
MAVAMVAGTAADADLVAHISAVAGIILAGIAAASRDIRSVARMSDAFTLAAAVPPRGTKTLAPCATPLLRRATRAMP